MAWSISNAMMKDYENSRCSQGRAAESLAVTCSDGEQSAPSSITPTPDQFYWPDKTTEHSRLSRFGMMCVPLTESLGADLLTWFRAGFPARTSAPQERGPDLMESEAAYGVRWQGSFARYDRDASLWRTAQSSLLAGLDVYLETWPRWGSMRNGASYLRPIPAHLISERESGLLPTLTVCGNYNKPGASKTSGWGLASVVAMLPTLCARDYRYPGKSRIDRTGSKSGEVLPQIVGGPLNPDWCEWFMAFPIGWTELKPLGMLSFHEWQQQHGRS